MSKVIQEQDIDQDQDQSPDVVTESLQFHSRRLRSTSDVNTTEAFAFNVTEYCQNVSEKNIKKIFLKLWKYLK